MFFAEFAGRDPAHAIGVGNQVVCLGLVNRSAEPNGGTQRKGLNFKAPKTA